MKNRLSVLKEMASKLAQDEVTQGILLEYKTFLYENDSKLKGNTEALKELNAVKFTLERTKAMKDWVKTQI